MGIAFPGESAEYRAARDRLLGEEIELRRAMEAVAAARRALPRGGAVPEDYVFQELGVDGAATDVRLSHLFAPGKDSLVIYSFMFPRDPRDERPGPEAGATALLPLVECPCPSCVSSARSAGRRRRARKPADQPRGRREIPAATDPHLRRGARLAAAAVVVVGHQQLQPRLPRRDRRGIAEADAQRVSPRRRDDPPLLGLRALLRNLGPRSGSPPCRHSRAGLEPVRPHAGRALSQLGRATALLMTDPSPRG